MDNCTKLKLLNVLLILCALNFFLYRFFSDDSNYVTKMAQLDSSAQQEDTLPDSKPSPWEIPAVIKSSGSGTGTSPINSNTKVQDITKQGENGTPGNLDTKPEVVVSGQGLGTIKSNVTATVNLKTTKEVTTDNLPLCPSDPPHLIGNMFSGNDGRLATYKDPKSFDEIAHDNPELRLGGRFSPSTCTALHRVAIVVPYRDREEHLKVLLRNLHPMLIRQQLDYGIYIVDQALPGKFNRAMLMNIGYVEALKRHGYQCAIFHDVDLIPEDDRNIYSCPEMPRHLSASIDKFNYKLPYAGIYGGVSAIRKEQFENMNGFSNLYFGWGGEDDDMAKRISLKGYKITRYPMEIARYKMIKHSRETHNAPNPKRFELLRSVSRRQATDGLNSLKYTVQEVEELPTHTRIKVLINEEDYIKS